MLVAVHMYTNDLTHMLDEIGLRRKSVHYLQRLTYEHVAPIAATMAMSHLWRSVKIVYGSTGSVAVVTASSDLESACGSGS